MRIFVGFLVIVSAVFMQSCGDSSGARTSMPHKSMNSDKGKGKAQASIRSGINAEANISVRKLRTYTKKEKQERTRPSFVPGLTKGQLEDMPETTALPTLFGLHHTQVQLDAHAMLAAREDISMWGTERFTLQQRFVFIQFLWTEEWKQRTELFQNVADLHEENTTRLRKSVGRNAAWQRLGDERRRKHKQEYDKIMQKELPVLTPEEARALRSL